MMMAAPAIVFATDYYASPTGAGAKDGTSWENAWGIDEFATQFNSTNAANFQNGDNVYFAAGKYAKAATFNIKKGINLIGAEGAERTVFSGDINGDGVANSGDRDRFLYIKTDAEPDNTEMYVTITNIDFDCFYIAQGGNDTKGAFCLDNCGALVTVSKCNFTNLINTGKGANAFFSMRSTLKVIDCTFTGCKAANRGVVARLQGESTTKGFTTFERCLFANNEATGAATDPCGIIMMQHGTMMNCVNCTFYNNKVAGKGACIWDGTAPDEKHKRILNVVSCTFANNTSGAEADADKVDILLNANSTANVLNSIVLGGVTTGTNINVQGNILNDKSYAEVFGTNELANNVLAPIAKNATMDGFAAAVAAIDPAINPAVDITKDQTGATRAANVIGAYDYDPTTTGITSVRTQENRNTPAYNLNGQRVNATAKGLYIINGKKIVL